MSVQVSSVEFYVCLQTGDVFLSGEFVACIDLDGDIYEQVEAL